MKLDDWLERRQQVRFQIHAVVEFEWFDGEGVRHRGRGLTRDISSKGLFILSDSRPPTKVDLQAEVFFGSISGSDTNLQLRTRAVVIRMESASRIGAHDGFAVLNKSYKLMSRDLEDLEDADLTNELN